MKETDAAWAAGIIDGEGCLCLTKPSKRGGFVWRVSVNSCDGAMALRMQELFGGKIYSLKPGKVGWRGQLKWVVDGARPVAEFLQSVLPYLVVKRAEGNELLAACARTEGQPFRKRHIYPDLYRHAERLSALKRESLVIEEV